MGASSPVGEPVMIQPRHLQNRVIQEGDQFVLLVETTGPGGFFCEIGRTCVLGKATQSMQDEFGFAQERRNSPSTCCGRARPAPMSGTATTIHGEERPPEGEPALLPRPGLSSGGAAAGALRREHAATGAHEHRHASDVSLEGHYTWLCDNFLIGEHVPNGCTRFRRRSWSCSNDSVGWAKSPAQVSRGQRLTRDFAHASIPNSRRCPPYAW